MILRHVVCAAVLVFLAADAGELRAQASAAPADSVAAAPVSSPPPAQSSKPPLRDRIYFGGSVVFSIGGDVSTIGVYPMIAYKLRPKWSVGLEAGYEHVTFDDFDQSADNYGGSLFTRYRVIPRMYLHAEYQMINYEVFTSPTTSDREWVPFLLLGGGLSTMMRANTWAYVEVLFDVLQDGNSPYDDWEPFVSVGVGVGF
jgi:cytochrome c1